MRTSTTIMYLSLATLLAAPSEAQYVAPAGVQRLELPVDRENGRATARRDTVEGQMDPVLGLVGGVIGAASGALIGGMFGGVAASGCTGELCHLGSVAIGVGLGESFGLALGTHLGAGGRGNVALSALSSFGILFGGVLVGVSAPRGTPAIALTIIPVIQLVAALAIER
jgi:hypothetical protein